MRRRAVTAALTASGQTPHLLPHSCYSEFDTAEIHGRPPPQIRLEGSWGVMHVCRAYKRGLDFIQEDSTSPNSVNGVGGQKLICIFFFTCGGILFIILAK
jgi:hypothetical protein